MTVPLIVMGLTFLTSRSANERARIALIALAGVLAIALFVAVLLSIEPVAALFTERASLEQSYDVGPMGRFGRYLLAVEFALDHPFGVGPLQFARLLQEAPHNVYLNSFMAGGWLAGFAYLTLTAVTVVMGLRYVLVATPWRRIYHAVYAAYLGVVTESLIVDSDHLHHHLVANFADAVHLVDILVVQFANMTKAIPPRQNFDECAEVFDRRDLALIDFTDFHFFSQRFDFPLHHPGALRAAGPGGAPSAA